MLTTVRQILPSAGVGTQFLAIMTGILVMALLNMFSLHRHGAVNIAVIVLYALTSCKFEFQH
jgi:transmembrane 9 superfamily member 1